MKYDSKKGGKCQMKNLLKKKSIVIVTSLVLILSIGSALANYAWISNQINGTTNVNNEILTFEGSFPTDVYLGQWQEANFNYTVNNQANTTGYIVVNFTGSFSDSSGVTWGNSTVYATSGPTTTISPAMTEYWFGDTITFVLTPNGLNETAIEFGSIGGTIVQMYKYNVPGNITVNMRASSSSTPY
jgi:hypothetical protein